MHAWGEASPRTLSHRSQGAAFYQILSRGDLLLLPTVGSPMLFTCCGNSSGRAISWELLMSYGSSFLFCTPGPPPTGPIVFAKWPGGLPSFKKIKEKEGKLLKWLPFPDACLHD